MSGFAESVVEDAALAWFGQLGWVVKSGQAVAPGELFAERTDFGQVVLERRLRDALTARVLDFDDPERNDWLAVNQFTVTENKHLEQAEVLSEMWAAA